MPTRQNRIAVTEEEHAALMERKAALYGERHVPAGIVLTDLVEFHRENTDENGSI